VTYVTFVEGNLAHISQSGLGVPRLDWITFPYLNIINSQLLHVFLIKSLGLKQKTDQNLTPDFAAHPPASIEDIRG
jgi:hypothetical protein